LEKENIEAQMSEAEKSDEIEDVLSSIRRLVAERPNATPEPVKPVEVQPMAPKAKADPTAQETTAQETAADTGKKPTSFVEKMNASIAQMTQDTSDKEPAPEETEIVTEKHADNLDAFLENAAQHQSNTVEPVVVTLEKPEPLVLRADMATGKKAATETIIQKAEPEVVEQPEAAFQESPEVDAEEIVMPDDIEDDEIALENTHEQPAAGQFIDEETIREIVSEMVRAELQGDLGDRITRNVRKLVRREIHHALATRELD
jgi:flagellar capping protein FliD